MCLIAYNYVLCSNIILNNDDKKYNHNVYQCLHPWKFKTPTYL